MKISRFDYKKQKELLEPHIGENILYKNKFYKIEDILSGPIQVTWEDYNRDTIWIICVLSNDNETINIPIEELFKILYPYLCWLESENFVNENF